MSTNKFIKYSKHLFFVEYIDIISKYSRSFDNFVGKLEYSLPIVIRELFQNTLNVITGVTYKLLNKKYKDNL